MIIVKTADYNQIVDSKTVPMNIIKHFSRVIALAKTAFNAKELEIFNKQFTKDLINNIHDKNVIETVGFPGAYSKMSERDYNYLFDDYEFTYDLDAMNPDITIDKLLSPEENENSNSNNRKR